MDPLHLPWWSMDVLISNRVTISHSNVHHTEMERNSVLSKVCYSEVHPHRFRQSDLCEIQYDSSVIHFSGNDYLGRDNAAGTKIYAVNGWEDIDIRYFGTFLHHNGRMCCGKVWYLNNAVLYQIFAEYVCRIYTCFFIDRTTRFIVISHLMNGHVPILVISVTM